MNRTQERIYAKIIDLANYSEDVIRARILFCEKYQASDFAMKEASKEWGIKARKWALIPTTFKTEWDKELGQFELLTLAELMRLGQADRALVASEWRSKTLSWGDVRLLVNKKLQRKMLKKKSLKSRLAAFICDLEKESECGAGLEMVCARKAIADKLREMLV